MDEEIEDVLITRVGELAIGGGELLKAMSGDGGEVSGELGVLSEHHRSTSNEAIDEPPATLLVHNSSPDLRKRRGEQRDLDKERLGFLISLFGDNSLAFGGGEEEIWVSAPEKGRTRTGFSSEAHCHAGTDGQGWEML